MEYYKILDLNNFPNEEWKDVIGYEGLYEVSSLGRVKSMKYGKEKILKPIKLNNGYLIVGLCKEGKSNLFQVHRLVANAFIPNLLNLPMINHIDENKENNAVDNLEWCTQKYNLIYGTCQKRRVAKIDFKAIGKKIAEKLTNGVLSKRVFQYSLDGELVKIWKSTRECGRNGYNQGNVVSCCRGELKHYKGYIWSYVPLEHI